MKIQPVSGVCLALFLVATAGAQETNLTRSEVAAIKAKIVTVQQAMGGDPSGYLKESEDFNLPTDSNPAQGGKYWPITSGVSLRYTDRGAAEGQANMEKAAAEFQAKMAAAVASGNVAGDHADERGDDAHAGRGDGCRADEKRADERLRSAQPEPDGRHRSRCRRARASRRHRAARQRGGRAEATSRYTSIPWLSRRLKSCRRSSSERPTTA